LAHRLSKTQVDRLGDRLRSGAFSEADLRLLDDYRRSFGEAYETVVRMVGEQLRVDPTGRPAKSTASIVEKLRRESIRLTQMQDITGCRIIVSDILEQDRIVASLHDLFPEASVVDRRENPSHGYRAVHVIVQRSGRSIEIQVRSELQHLWAELSEKLSDVIDPSLKYGGGPTIHRGHLENFSRSIQLIEGLEAAAAKRLGEGAPDREQLLEILEESKQAKASWSNILDEIVAVLERIRVTRQ
jgi:putative GTP pyrophosphokinase